jgi:hypothetical protein
MKLKRKLNRITLSALGSLFLIFSFSFTLPDHKIGATVLVDIEHYVEEQILKLDSTPYKNALGQTFTVSKFKYYIGEIALKQKDGKLVRSSDYFLINEEEDVTKHLSLKSIPPGNYTSMEFIIGVDSLHNCSGAQSGALDPVNGMFWAWNSGYIFLKLEGISSASKSPGHIFEYHIGGYKQPSNCIRKITLPLDLSVKESGTSPLVLRADVSKILSSETTVNFEQLSSVTDFHNAALVANNYMSMFSIRIAHEH